MNSLDPVALIALFAVGLNAWREFRLMRENRRKVIAEGSRDEAQAADLITQGAGRLVQHWEDESRRLRERLEQLEDNEEHMAEQLRSCHRRIDQLAGLLRQHGIAVPAAD